MADPNISLSPTTLARLEEMAHWSGLPVAEILERAVNDHYGRQFWDAVNAGYAALRADPAAWAEIESERRLWENTLRDGLDPSENWADDADSPNDKSEQTR
jgi:hypothetical protein